MKSNLGELVLKHLKKHGQKVVDGSMAQISIGRRSFEGSLLTLAFQE